MAGETEAWDDIAKAVGCPAWAYPGQLVRDVQNMAAELAKLRSAAPAPPPLDAACESLMMWARERPGRVTIHVWQDGVVDMWDGDAKSMRAHLHGADGLPTPAEAVAKLRGGKTCSRCGAPGACTPQSCGENDL